MAGAIVDFFGFEHYNNWTAEIKMRGVQIFTSKLRQCKTCEEEDEIINKELAKIRNVLNNQVIDGYMKKKCVCKLIYIFLLGRKIEFGHTVALSLLSSNVYSEKRTGYLFISLIFNVKSKIKRLLVQCIKMDLLSSNMNFIHVALQCVANFCDRSMASELVPVVVRLIDSPITNEVLKSSLLCLSKFVGILENSYALDLLNKAARLIGHEDLGVVSCATTLIDSSIKCDAFSVESSTKREITLILVTEVKRILNRSRPGLAAYEYHKATASWILTKILRCLQLFDATDHHANRILHDCLETILTRFEAALANRSSAVSTSVKSCNAVCMVLSEVVALVTSFSDDFLHVQVTRILEHFLKTKKPNLVLMAVEAVRKLATKSIPVPFSLQDAIIQLLYQKDLIIILRTIDFLADSCDPDDISDIAGRLLEFLKTADDSIAAAAAPRVANLFQRAAASSDCYIDILVELHAILGRDLDEKITFEFLRSLQSFQVEQHRRAATKIFGFLGQKATSNETIIELASFVLGRWGHLIADDENSSFLAQWVQLKAAFKNCRSKMTKAKLLTCFLRMAHRHKDFVKPAIELFEENSRSADIEIQQRSTEYITMLKLLDEEVQSAIFHF